MHIPRTHFSVSLNVSVAEHNVNYLHSLLIATIMTVSCLTCLFFFFFFLPLQRRLNVDCYNISPDLNFILLYECLRESDSNNTGTKYFVYEIFSTNFYPLTPNSSVEVELQKILWSPGSYDSNLANNDIISSISLNNNNNNNNNNFNSRQKKVLPNSKTKVKFEKSKLTQAIAFIHDYDIYYKPKTHSDLVIRVTTNGELFTRTHAMHDILLLLLRVFAVILD
jgi:hypothetical protein